MSANPSWYDLLDVDPTASADEIRAAWKAAIAELDPTDRKFRVLNQAAEVLLDPQERATYDMSLAPEPEPVTLEKPAAATEPEIVDHTPGTPSPTTSPAPSPGAPGRIPGWLLIGVAVATLLFVGLCVWQVQQNEDEPASTSSTGDSLADAQAAAEKAAVAITAYDYRDLEGSRSAAIPFMTKAYQAKYDRLFAVLEENAPTTKTIVRTQLVASAIGLVGEDRIQVLVFFDRSTTNAVVTDGQITRDQATFTMAQEDGEWLVDDLTTTLPGS